MTAVITPARVRELVLELIDENPFAIRAVLKMLGLAFTHGVTTLAVTCEDRPRLLINPEFVARSCATDAHVKAVLCHEFLHVLLRHTEDARPLTRVRHLALDAVINAIIHRQLGPDYSSMMARYYAHETGLQRLLRPMNAGEQGALRAAADRTGPAAPAWALAWNALYEGRLVADDIEELAEALRAASAPGDVGRGIFDLAPGDADIGRLLGNHDHPEGDLPQALADALDCALKEMNGSGVWRAPRGRRVVAQAAALETSAKALQLGAWRARTLLLLKRFATPDRRARAHRDDPASFVAPVLSPHDRRSALSATWSPFIPEAVWPASVRRPAGTAQIYLDVSGSMSAEMPLIIGLLGQLSHLIRRPFWAFSDVVAPAVIQNGALKSSTTGGTSMTCVLDHIARTRPAAAIVVTDGYIEPISPCAVEAAARTRLHALVTRDGNPSLLRAAGIAYSQLDRAPS